MQQKLSFKVINRDGINLNTKGELHNFLYPLAMLSSSTIFKVSQMCTTILRSLICKHVSSLQKKISNHFINSCKILLVLLRISVTTRYVNHYTLQTIILKNLIKILNIYFLIFHFYFSRCICSTCLVLSLNASKPINIYQCQQRKNKREPTQIDAIYVDVYRF